MGSAGRSKKTGTNRKGTKEHKRGVRKKFRARHVDQVYTYSTKCISAVQIQDSYACVTCFFYRCGKTLESPRACMMEILDP